MGTLPSWGLVGVAVFLTYVLPGMPEGASHCDHVHLSVALLHGANPQSVSPVGEQMFWMLFLTRVLSRDSPDVDVKWGSLKVPQ